MRRWSARCCLGRRKVVWFVVCLVDGRVVWLWGGCREDLFLGVMLLAYVLGDGSGGGVVLVFVVFCGWVFLLVEWVGWCCFGGGGCNVVDFGLYPFFKVGELFFEKGLDVGGDGCEVVLGDVCLDGGWWFLISWIVLVVWVSWVARS